MEKLKSLIMNRSKVLAKLFGNCLLKTYIKLTNKSSLKFLILQFSIDKVLSLVIDGGNIPSKVIFELSSKSRLYNLVKYFKESRGNRAKLLFTIFKVLRWYPISSGNIKFEKLPRKLFLIVKEWSRGISLNIPCLIIVVEVLKNVAEVIALWSRPGNNKD